ncbi:MAG: dockerin type I repeat-containing protein [Patescibacteria group bacterium]
MRPVVRTLGRSLLVMILVFPLLVLPANADITVSVSATVPSIAPPEPTATSVILKGIAYPGSTVTILQNGVTAVQVPADPQARFDVTIGGLTAGTYTFGVFSVDQDGRDGPTSNFTLTLATGTSVTITGIFLGPTIAADKTEVRLGDTITVFGTTSPSSTVQIYVSSETETSSQVSASTAGAWSKQFQASDLQIGSHSVRSKATDPDGSVSEFSRSVAFQVATTELCAGKTKGDINCDGKVDLVDFSILLFYWNKRNPANARADINQDGTVNIIDFSVMLYFWTGTK